MPQRSSWPTSPTSPRSPSGSSAATAGHTTSASADLTTSWPLAATSTSSSSTPRSTPTRAARLPRPPTSARSRSSLLPARPPRRSPSLRSP
jgi:hypothetical protein